MFRPSVRRPTSRCLHEALESRTLLSAGDLDTTFGGDGVVVLNDVTGIFNDVVVQGDGRILAAGFARNAADTESDFFLARFNPDGSPDATFGGGDGRVTADFGGNNSASRLALRPDGKIVAYGTELARFLPDGRLDTTFGGGDGFVAFPPLPQFSPAINGLSLQADNKIVIARNASVYRYTADGQLDTTFGTDGRFIATDLERSPGVPVFNSFRAADVAVQPGGGIVVAAEAYIHEADGGPYYGHTYDFTVLRLTPGGQVDRTFAGGDEGGDFFAWEDADADDEVNRMSVSPDGHIAIVGTEGDEDAHHIFVDPDGDNIVLRTLNWGYGAAHDIAFDSKGRTPSAGYQKLYNDDEYERKAVRAARDSSFGGPGGVITNLVIGDDEALGLAIEPDDDVVLSGYLRTNDIGAATHPFVLRYEGETRTGISLVDGALRVDGTAADDMITVQATADSVVARYNGQTQAFPRSAVKGVFANGNGGADAITLSGIGGSLTGGPGDDTLRGPDSAGVFLFGGDGNDKLFAGAGGTTLAGEGGNDSLVGGIGRDTLDGGAGDDTLDGGAGTAADDFRGGPGVDTADYSARTTTLNLSLDAVANDGEAGENDSLSQVEKVRGGSGNDRITAVSFVADGYAFFGNAGDDELIGTNISDALWGGSGNDYLDGVDANDYLNGGAGNDTLIGGQGDDALDDTSGTNSIDGGPGADTVNGAPENQPQDVVLQAEDARVVGARLSRSNTGYTGTGYVDFSHPRGDFIEWTLGSAAAGTRRVEFRYANGSRSPRILQLTVNGRTVKGQFDFAPTGSWTTWKTVSVDVPVVAGANRLRVASNRFEGPNIDFLADRGLVPTTPLEITLDAELATLSGVKVSSSNADYTGSGYADYSDTPGSYVEWNFGPATAARRTLTFRYANGAASDRPLELTVNGQVVNPRLPFAPTGTWAQWGVISVTVDLVAGTNTVRLTSVGPSGPNLDVLSVQ
jgi:uncharacterized delta-60 repeat protein